MRKCLYCDRKYDGAFHDCHEEDARDDRDASRACLALAAIGFAFQRIVDHHLAVAAVGYVLPWNADPQRAAGVVDRFVGVLRVASGVTSEEAP